MLSKKLEIAPIENKMRESRLQSPITTQVKRSDMIIIAAVRTRGSFVRELGWKQLKGTWKYLMEEMTLNRIDKRK